MKKYTITVNGTAYEVEVEDMGGAAALKQPHRKQLLLQLRQPHRKQLLL